MTELEKAYEELQNELIETKKQLYDNTKALDNLKKQFFESGERYKTDLRAIHFMLSELQAVGTHHEKEVVIRYIKNVLEKHIIRSVGYYPDSDELPF